MFGTEARVLGATPTVGREAPYMLGWMSCHAGDEAQVLLEPMSTKRELSVQVLALQLLHEDTEVQVAFERRGHAVISTWRGSVHRTR